MNGKNINVEIPEELHKKLKIKALVEDKSLKETIITMLNKK